MSGAAAGFAVVAPPDTLFHLGRAPNPVGWWPATALDPEDAAGGGRFDAPNGDYSTLYSASDRYGCLLEKFADLRVTTSSGELDARIDAAVEHDGDGDYQPLVTRTFPADGLKGWQMGKLQIDPDAQFVDVAAPETHTALHRLVGNELLRTLGLRRFDMGAFSHPDRRVTRQVAEELHVLLAGSVAGIRYPSTLDPDVELGDLGGRARPADLPSRRRTDRSDLTRPGDRVGGARTDRAAPLTTTGGAVKRVRRATCRHGQNTVRSGRAPGACIAPLAEPRGDCLRAAPPGHWRGYGICRAICSAARARV